MAGRVATIRLQHLSLSELDATTLPVLVKLDLVGNTLAGPISAPLAHAVALVVLRLGSNNLTGGVLEF